MNKYLTKVAKRYSDTKDHISSNVNAGLVGGALGLGGIGTATSAFTGGDLTGRETLWHGTTPENADKIRAEGLSPGKSEGIGKRLEKITGSDAYQSDHTTYMTPKKGIASQFVAQSNYIAGGATDMDIAYRNQDAVFKKKMMEEQIKSLLPQGHAGSPYVKARVPLGALPTVSNPELAGEPFLRSTYDPSSSMQERGIYDVVRDTLNSGTRVFKGEVPTKYIIGSPDYQKLTAREVLTHIKNNPGLAAKGVGKVLAGGAMIAAAPKAFRYMKDTSDNNQTYGEKVRDRALLGVKTPGAATAALKTVGTGIGVGAALGTAKALYDIKTKHKLGVDELKALENLHRGTAGQVLNNINAQRLALGASGGAFGGFALSGSLINQEKR